MVVLAAAGAVVSGLAWVSDSGCWLAWTGGSSAGGVTAGVSGMLLSLRAAVLITVCFCGGGGALCAAGWGGGGIVAAGAAGFDATSPTRSGTRGSVWSTVLWVSLAIRPAMPAWIATTARMANSSPGRCFAACFGKCRDSACQTMPEKHSGGLAGASVRQSVPFRAYRSGARTLFMILLHHPQEGRKLQKRCARCWSGAVPRRRSRGAG